jgi:hypothetical protein
MNISLTPELAKFVEKEVESGLYQTAPAGKDDSGQSRMRESCMSALTRERSMSVIGR